MGGVAVVRVGAATEIEMKEKKARVEDALHATRAAVEEGVVPGGGTAYLWAARALDKLAESLKEDNPEQQVGVKIVRQALEAPLRQIAGNAGFDGSVVVDKVINQSKGNSSFGFDAAREEYGDLVERGIIDPTKVVRCALQNAASVASLLITTEAMIADKPEEKGQSAGPGGMPHGGMGGMPGMM